MSPSTPPQAGRTVAVAVFDLANQAREAVQALTGQGISQAQIELVVPGEGNGDASRATDLGELLDARGVPEGERRFYMDAIRSGRAVVLVEATENYAAARDLMLQQGGYDVQSKGAELARDDGAGVPGGTGPRPTDVSGRWEDVSSRYEMLWQQHYGTSDATWDEMEPIYRFAWDVANEPQLRGRTWSEAEQGVRRQWESSIGLMAWADVAGPIRDVWEDVAAEAATFAEGGQARNIPPKS